MSETIQKSAPTIDLTPTNSLLASGSPKGMYVYFLLALSRNFFECATNGASDDSLERAAGALIAFCPNTTERRRLWEYYHEQRKETKSQYTASIYAIGELVSYLSAVLEFEESSTAGLM